MRPGVAATLGALAVAGALDVAVLAATGRDPLCEKDPDSITRTCREHPVITAAVLAAFVAHLTQRPQCLARFDPFRAIGAAASAVQSVWP